MTALRAERTLSTPIGVLISQGVGYDESGQIDFL
jgi:hypothetical protein